MGSDLVRETPYPWDDKKLQYEAMSTEHLNYALHDARKALETAEDMERDGFIFDGRKGPRWRSDDVFCILGVLRARAAREASKAGIFGKTFDNGVI